MGSSTSRRLGWAAFAAAQRGQGSAQDVCGFRGGCGEAKLSGERAARGGGAGSGGGGSWAGQSGRGDQFVGGELEQRRVVGEREVRGVHPELAFAADGTDQLPDAVRPGWGEFSDR